MQNRTKERLKTGALVISCALALVGGATAATHIDDTSTDVVNNAATIQAEQPAQSDSPEEHREPAVRTVTETETVKTPYETKEISDDTLEKGQRVVAQGGVDGEDIKYYTVTYRDDVETERVLDRTETAKAPTDEIIKVGTYVAPAAETKPSQTQPKPTAQPSPSSSQPSQSSQQSKPQQSQPQSSSQSQPQSSSQSQPSTTNSETTQSQPSTKPQATTNNNSTTTSCQNGTYVNSAGNKVCRPSDSNTGGATAICKDGSYSYSQSRKGTCSHHGGVKEWL